jgi:hypothetical protein
MEAPRARPSQLLSSMLRTSNSGVIKFALAMAVVPQFSNAAIWAAAHVDRQFDVCEMPDASSNFRFLLPPSFPEDTGLSAAEADVSEILNNSCVCNGGRDRDRTCDPYDVNVVLSR